MPSLVVDAMLTGAESMVVNEVHDIDVNIKTEVRL